LHKIPSYKEKKQISHILFTNTPKNNDLLKAFTRERKIDFPLIEGEKGFAFRDILRDYIFKFSLV
jgi:hypothetical protein